MRPGDQHRVLRHRRPATAAGTRGPVQDAVPVHVLAGVERGDRAVEPARRDHRDLALEVDEALEHRRRLADRDPGLARRGAGIEPHLPLAVVAEAGGSSGSPGVPSVRERRRQRLRPVHRADRARSRGRARAGSPSPRARSCATSSARRPGRTGTSGASSVHRRKRHVLELVGDDVDRRGEGAERGGVVVAGAGHRVRHLRRAGRRPARRRGSASRAAPRPCASIRPSCPPPRMPMRLPGGSGTAGLRRHPAPPPPRRSAPRARPRAAPARLRPQAASIAAARSPAFAAPAGPIASVPTGTPFGICTMERRRIEPGERLRLHRHPEHRQPRLRRQHPRQVRRTAGPGDDRLQPAPRRRLGIGEQPVRRAVRRDDPDLVAGRRARPAPRPPRAWSPSRTGCP